jgi:hypothetical protein
MRLARYGVAALCVLSIPTLALAAPVNQVPYASLTGTALITFDDVPGGGAPGTNYDGIFESGNAAFAERFVGQTLGASGPFDTLSGTPSAPLALQVGAPGRNLNVFVNAGSQVLTGLGNLGFPSFDAIGEGSFAVLFDFDQSQFGFQLVGGDSGTATVSFFARNGTLIDSVTLTGLADAFYGFSREGGVQDIAGISITNNDPAGVGFDNLLSDVQGVPGTPGDTIPEPGTLLLLGSGLAGLRLIRRRRQQ